MKAKPHQDPIIVIIAINNNNRDSHTCICLHVSCGLVCLCGKPERIAKVFVVSMCTMTEVLYTACRDYKHTNTRQMFHIPEYTRCPRKILCTSKRISLQLSPFEIDESHMYLDRALTGDVFVMKGQHLVNLCGLSWWPMVLGVGVSVRMTVLVGDMRRRTGVRDDTNLTRQSVRG